jgi:hypothetical protein
VAYLLKARILKPAETAVARQWLSSNHMATQIDTNAGRAVAQQLDAGFPPPWPRFVYGQHVGFVLDKAALGQVFSEYFGFPCQSFH